MSRTQQRRQRLTATGALALAVAFVVGQACKGTPSGQGSGCGSTGADVTINAQDNLTYDKPSLQVTMGDRVCWQNIGSVQHTVTADPASPLDSTWNIDGQLSPNLVVLRTFGKVGDYPYHCFYHAGQNMRGVIRVR